MDSVTVRLTYRDFQFLLVVLAYATWWEESHENSVDFLSNLSSFKHRLADEIHKQRISEA